MLRDMMEEISLYSCGWPGTSSFPASLTEKASMMKSLSISGWLSSGKSVYSDGLSIDVHRSYCQEGVCIMLPSSSLLCYFLRLCRAHVVVPTLSHHRQSSSAVSLLLSNSVLICVQPSLLYTDHRQHMCSLGSVLRPWFIGELHGSTWGQLEKIWGSGKKSVSDFQVKPHITITCYPQDEC